MVDRGRARGLQVTAARILEKPAIWRKGKVVNPKILERGGKRTGGKSVVGGLRDPVLANLMQLRGVQQFKKMRYTMNPMLCKGHWQVR